LYRIVGGGGETRHEKLPMGGVVWRWGGGGGVYVCWASLFSRLKERRSVSGKSSESREIGSKLSGIS